VTKEGCPQTAKKNKRKPIFGRAVAVKKLVVDHRRRNPKSSTTERGRPPKHTTLTRPRGWEKKKSKTTKPQPSPHAQLETEPLNLKNKEKLG